MLGGGSVKFPSIEETFLTVFATRSPKCNGRDGSEEEPAHIWRYSRLSCFCFGNFFFLNPNCKMLSIRVVTLGAFYLFSFCYYEWIFWWPQMQVGYGKVWLYLIPIVSCTCKVVLGDLISEGLCLQPGVRFPVAGPLSPWKDRSGWVMRPLSLVPGLAGRARSKMSKKGAISGGRFRLKYTYRNSSSLSLFSSMGLEAS